MKGLHSIIYIHWVLHYSTYLCRVESLSIKKYRYTHKVTMLADDFYRKIERWYTNIKYFIVNLSIFTILFMYKIYFIQIANEHYTIMIRVCVWGVWGVWGGGWVCVCVCVCVCMRGSFCKRTESNFCLLVSLYPYPSFTISQWSDYIF